MNLGFGGNGPLTEFATLREYLNPKMKKIVWIYFAGNDFKDLERELGIKILKRYMQDDGFKQNLIKQQLQIDSLNRKIMEKYEISSASSNRYHFSKVLNFIKLVETRKILSNRLPSKTNENLELLSKNYFFKILKMAKILADENGSKLFFVYLPDYESFKFNQENTLLNNTENFLKTLGVQFINIQKEIMLQNDNPMTFYPFGLPGHFNQEGYKFVSELILERTSAD